MIRLTTPLLLDSADEQELSAIQQAIDSGVDYPTRVGLAAQKWKTKPVFLFQRVRQALEVTCLGALRCSYCEDSLADEIEHIRPKSWFPEQTFDLSNYLFACGPCNGPKSSSYAAVNHAGQLLLALRTKNSPLVPPPIGQEALLHPWHDEPADFFFLDLTNTFEFKPRQSLNAHQNARALYTLQVLRINKDPLLKARKEAFYDFAGRLKSYYLASQNNDPLPHLQLMRDELLRKQHITVWREMQRQSATLTLLAPLFQLVPGAESW